MSQPKKPRPGRKRQVPRPTAPQRRAARTSARLVPDRAPKSARPDAARETSGNGDARHAAPPRPPAAGATLGAEHERASGGLFSRARAIARSAPDLRPDVVERYKKLIGEGRYAPDPADVAERMIRESLEDLLGK